MCAMGISMALVERARTVRFRPASIYVNCVVAGPVLQSCCHSLLLCTGINHIKYTQGRGQVIDAAMVRGDKQRKALPHTCDEALILQLCPVLAALLAHFGPHMGS